MDISDIILWGQKLLTYFQFQLIIIQIIIKMDALNIIDEIS